MRAHIFRRPKTAMQSGQAGTHEWVLTYEPAVPQRNDPLMGWAGSSDTHGQVALHFPTSDEAVKFARAQGMAFDLELPPPVRPLRPKVYADNFRYGRHENWTH
jgi:hypothetical protein